MRKLSFLLLLAIVALSSSAGAQTGNQLDQLADKIVNTVLQAKANQLIVINADPSNMSLVEALNTSLREVGAFAIVDMGSNREATLYFQRVSSRFDSQPPKDFLTLARIADAIVNIQFPADPSAVKGVPAARLNETGRAFNAYTDYILKRSIPTISVGNGLMPSAATAKSFGATEEQLSTIFWRGLDTNYSTLHRDGVAMFGAVTRAHSVHVTSPGGTNFTFRALATAGLINDGVISTADRTKGGPAVQKQLPAGDVYFVPVPGTASGTIAYGPLQFNGVDVSGMKVTFKNGAITSMHATTGGSEVAKFYASSGTGRNQFGWIDFGVNRAMSLPPARWAYGPSMAAGYITAGLGNNLAFGGTNRSAFGFASNIPSGTVTVDGKTVIASGKLGSFAVASR